MGVTLAKFIESSGAANRALYYLDDGEIDLPILIEDTSIDPGSIAVCPKTGFRWYLNSKRVWTRAVIDLEDTTHLAGGGSGTAIQNQESADIAIPKVSEIIISPEYIEIKPGDKVQFVAKVIGSNLVTEDVIWSVVPSTYVHQDTKISLDGILTTSTQQRNGTFEIRATSKDDKTVYGTAKVKSAISGPTPDPVVTGIAISPKTVTQAAGSSVQFKANVSGLKDFDKRVHWELLGATDSMIYQDGTVEIGKNELSNALIVKVYSEIYSQYWDAGTLVVAKEGTNLNPTNIEIKPETAALMRGTKLLLAGIVQGKEGITTELVWSVEGNRSSNTYVSSNGLLCVGEDETSSSLTVKAVSCQNPELYDEVTYPVLPEKDPGDENIIFVQFILNHPKVQKGGSAQFVAITAGTNVKDESVVYSLTNNTSPYTSIDSSGILIVATEEKASSVLITATSVEDPSKDDMTVVVIEPMGGSGGGGSGEDEKWVPEVDLSPVNTFYLRGVDASGQPLWKPATEVLGVEEAPTTELNAEYIRKTTKKGKNTWVKSSYISDAPVDVPGKRYVRKTTEDGTNIWVEDPEGVEEAPNEGVEKQYVRQTNADGTHMWVEAKVKGEVEEAPTDVEGAQYVRKTQDGKNIWERFFGGDGIPTMTSDEWNALAPDQRPPLAYIKENWLRPIKTYITDENGYLY